MDHRRALVALSAVGLTAGLALPVATAGPAGAAPRGAVALAGSRSPAAARTATMGPVAGASPVDFQLVLAPCTPGAAAQLARAVSTPGTAQYRHFLTASQWEARFSSSRRRTETQSGGPSQL